MSSAATAGTTRVLVAAGTPAECDLLAATLLAGAGISVVGKAYGGSEVVREAARLRPDVIVLTIHLPGLDGYAATRRIMETCPTRVILTTSDSAVDLPQANQQAVDAGALMVLHLPDSTRHPLYAPAAHDLVRFVRLMSEVRVVKRWPRRNVPLAPVARVQPASAAAKIVAIGASTGGPIALQVLLSGLPKDFPLPLLIVQHISDRFIDGLAKWLSETTQFPVRVGAAGERVQPRTAYLAPDHFHMQINASGTIDLVDTPKEHGTKPSASVLFRSVTATFGASAIGVLLTGMGRDGAQELKAMRDAGATTFAQDRESSVVFGMPGAAVALDAATHVLPPAAIASRLAEIAGCKKS